MLYFCQPSSHWWVTDQSGIRTQQVKHLNYMQHNLLLVTTWQQVISFRPDMAVIRKVLTGLTVLRQPIRIKDTMIVR